MLADAPKSLYYFDFDGKQIHQIVNVNNDFGFGLSVSPDGRWILYFQVTGKTYRDLRFLPYLPCFLCSMCDFLSAGAHPTVRQVFSARNSL